ncbi:hypothetical protein BDK51DRAFT_44952 [Blyttiomyces helicus]|uniref:Hydrophobic surface binding protein A-domain-containing protein n=1 Tax=Blyttiomyces helicus TaxID=388810 RepID=A0A4P9WH02_9FUNG|nr:hypothetical protein BDK51DRAFT_44952 [Blyttiomyces helicus]|eukprot:RKO90668.1 hypothetical protein BDK51DRAFT_44952 [Blyttiomyces helicus]
MHRGGWPAYRDLHLGSREAADARLSSPGHSALQPPRRLKPQEGPSAHPGRARGAPHCSGAHWVPMGRSGAGPSLWPPDGLHLTPMGLGNFTRVGQGQWEGGHPFATSTPPDISSLIEPGPIIAGQALVFGLSPDGPYATLKGLGNFTRVGQGQWEGGHSLQRTTGGQLGEQVPAFSSRSTGRPRLRPRGPGLKGEEGCSKEGPARVMFARDVPVRVQMGVHRSKGAKNLGIRSGDDKEQAFYHRSHTAFPFSSSNSPTMKFFLPILVAAFLAIGEYYGSDGRFDRDPRLAGAGGVSEVAKTLASRTSTVGQGPSQNAKCKKLKPTHAHETEEWETCFMHASPSMLQDGTIAGQPDGRIARFRSPAGSGSELEPPGASSKEIWATVPGSTDVAEAGTTMKFTTIIASIFAIASVGVLAAPVPAPEPGLLDGLLGGLGGGAAKGGAGGGLTALFGSKGKGLALNKARLQVVKGLKDCKKALQAATDANSGAAADATATASLAKISTDVDTADTSVKAIAKNILTLQAPGADLEAQVKSALTDAIATMGTLLPVVNAGTNTDLQSATADLSDALDRTGKAGLQVLADN